MICSGDFGRIVELKTHRKLSNHEKYVSLKQHFIPIASYKFPSRIMTNNVVSSLLGLRSIMEGTVNSVYCLGSVKLLLKNLEYL